MTELTGLASILLLAVGVGVALQFAGARGHHLAQPQRTPYLGGGSPCTHAWQRYHVRYYPMALLFIAFEMEMMFMYPWAAVYVAEGAIALAEMGMFLAILAIGIVYGWREGIFRWQ